MRSRRPRLGRTVLISVSLAGILAAALFLQFTRDRAQAYARVSSGSRMIDTACGPIEYGVVGEGPPVLLVHGAGGGFDQGLQFGAPLVSAGFTVIAPSRFGYLRTPVPGNVTPAAQADAHACLLDALGIETVAAFGGSAGAPSVVHLCLRHPERCTAMVLVVPAIFLPVQSSTPHPPSRLAELLIRTTLRSDLLFWVATRAARGSMIESILATPMDDVRRAPRDEQRRVYDTLNRIAPIRPRARGLAIDAAVTTAPSPYPFEQIAVPTLVVGTRNDRFGTLAGAAAAASRVPGARQMVFEDGGHLWVGHQRQLWSRTAAFLRKQAQPATSSAQS